MLRRDIGAAILPRRWTSACRSFAGANHDRQTYLGPLWIDDLSILGASRNTHADPLTTRQGDRSFAALHRFLLANKQRRLHTLSSPASSNIDRARRIPRASSN